MTIAEAIASCDAQQPNAYSAAEKRRWLSELDGQLYDEVFLTHQDPPSFTPYTADTPQTTQLLLPHPHDRLYPLYLTLQLDRCNGEIGELHGVRFIESNMAPVMVGAPLYSESQRYLTLAARAAATAGAAISGGYGLTGSQKWTVTEDLTAAACDYAALVGQYVLLSDNGAVTNRMLVTGVDPANKAIYTGEGSNASFTVEAGKDFLLPGNGGAESKAAGKPVAVYATMLFGRDAFGVVSPEGAGMEMIIKTGDQAGGPLNQFSTVGGKMSHGARVLYPDRMLTIYSASSDSATDEGNWNL